VAVSIIANLNLTYNRRIYFYRMRRIVVYVTIYFVIIGSIKFHCKFEYDVSCVIRHSLHCFTNLNILSHSCDYLENFEMWY